MKTMSVVLVQLLVALCLSSHIGRGQQRHFYTTNDTINNDTLLQKGRKWGKDTINCYRCHGVGNIVRNDFICFSHSSTEKRKCSICGLEYPTNFKHYHMACPDCKGKGFVIFKI